MRTQNIFVDIDIISPPAPKKLIAPAEVVCEKGPSQNTRLQTARISKNMNLAELATLSKIKITQLRLYECGKERLDVATLRVLQTVLETTDL